jgi:hypothetical protein
MDKEDMIVFDTSKSETSLSVDNEEDKTTKEATESAIAITKNILYSQITLVNKVRYPDKAIPPISSYNQPASSLSESEPSNDSINGKFSIFWRAWEELEKKEGGPTLTFDAESEDGEGDWQGQSENKVKTVTGMALKPLLVIRGFCGDIGEAEYAIQQMVRSRKLEKVSFDTYKRIQRE